MKRTLPPFISDASLGHLLGESLTCLANQRGSLKITLKSDDSPNGGPVVMIEVNETRSFTADGFDTKKLSEILTHALAYLDERCAQELVGLLKGMDRWAPPPEETGPRP